MDAHAHLVEARQLHEELHGNAQRVAERQNQERQPLVRGNEPGIEHKRGNRHEVVEYRRCRAPEVLAFGIQDAGDDRRERVEHDLDREEAEEVD